jgi:hypothetical protein
MARKTTKNTKTKAANAKVNKETVSIKSKTVEELRFEIDQLRKEKMAYSLESIATTLAALLFLISISIYFPRQNVRTYYDIGFTIALGFWILTVIINLGKLAKIKKLGKELKGE